MDLEPTLGPDGHIADDLNAIAPDLDVGNRTGAAAVLELEVGHHRVARTADAGHANPGRGRRIGRSPEVGKLLAVKHVGRVAEVAAKTRAVSLVVRPKVEVVAAGKRGRLAAQGKARIAEPPIGAYQIYPLGGFLIIAVAGGIYAPD